MAGLLVDSWVEIRGIKLPVQMKRSLKAKRLSLRLCRAHASVQLTLPRRVSVSEALAFLSKQHEWIARHAKPPAGKLRFEHEAHVPLLGQSLRIVHTGKPRGIVTLEDQNLLVPGDTQFIARRVTDWLKKKAQSHFSEAAHRFAAQLGKTITRVTVRDMKSRWGSCSNTGRLCFSWRIIMAPAFVAEYLCAHEVAHLCELNHGPNFWRVVRQLCPQMHEAKAWLRAHGHELHSFGH